jgi:hypothetical protein
MTDDEDWTTHAACRDEANLELVDACYHLPGGTGRDARAALVHEHVLMCRACPVVARCLDYATELIRHGPGAHSETPRHGWAGVWGGVHFGANGVDISDDDADRANQCGA